jgi:hypothetical protein
MLSFFRRLQINSIYCKRLDYIHSFIFDIYKFIEISEYCEKSIWKHYKTGEVLEKLR